MANIVEGAVTCIGKKRKKKCMSEILSPYLPVAVVVVVVVSLVVVASAVVDIGF